MKLRTALAALALTSVSACTPDVVDQPPVALSRGFVTHEDTPLTFTLEASDPEHERLTFATGAAAHGTISGDGATLTYTPNPNYFGVDTAAVDISDGHTTVHSSVDFTVEPVNDAPMAEADQLDGSATSATTVMPATLLANDLDVDGDVLTLIAVGNATRGTISLINGVITYTPPGGFTGPMTWSYTVSDGVLTAQGQVTMTLGSSMNEPMAVDDSVTTDEDTVVTVLDGTLLANDTDPDQDPLSLTAVSGATHGSVSSSGNTITFTPDANFNGEAGFDYTLSDGAQTTTGHVVVTVKPVNDAPIALDDTATTLEDTVLTIPEATLLANDSDDTGTPTLVSVANPSNGTVTLLAGVVTFTPAADVFGTASFEYTITDGTLTATARVDITLTAVNDAPVALPDVTAGTEDVVVTLADTLLLANDSDVEGSALTLTAVSGATHGTVSLSGGTITFTPAADYVGDATFSYTVSDGAIGSTGLVNITFAPVNDAPVAGDDAALTLEDTALSLSAATLLSNDTDVDSTGLSVTSVRNVVNGTAVLTAGTVLFTPNPNFFGTASFEYVVSDGSLSDVGLVTIDVTSVDDLPVAVADTASTDEDTALTSIDVLGNDTGLGDGNLVVTITVAPQHGVAVVNVDRTVRFTPTKDFAGADVMTYQVADGDGDVSTATVTLTVNAVNDAPAAIAQSASTNRNTAKVLTLTATDVDSASATFAVGTAPTHGTLGTLAGAGPLSATVTYTPAAGYAGADSFTFTANDGTLTSTEATVELTVVVVVQCGDGYIDAPETCDDGLTAANDGCSASCALEPGWNCTAAPSVCTSICGDTRVVGTEQCDDGNASDTDGCTTKCVTARVCDATNFTGGDGFATDPATGTCYALFTAEPTTQSAAQTSCLGLGGYLVSITSAGEQARVQTITQGVPWIGAVDDANDTDTVFVWLKPEAWSYTHFAAGEPDDDATVGGNGECLAIQNAAGEWGDTNCNFVGFTDGRLCELPANPCGDGFIEGAEACDDGNRVGSDGCSATCTVELGASCSGTAPTTCSKLVINEIDYDTVGAENSGGQFEFVEILNAGTAAADLTNVALVLISGAGANEYFFDGTSNLANVGKRVLLTSAAVPSNSLRPGGIIVVGTTGLFALPTFPASAFKIPLVAPASGWVQNGSPDAVALMNVGSAPFVIDGYSYEGATANASVLGLTGTFVVTEGATNATCDNGVAGGMSRFPNGKDTQDNNADFQLRAVTPGLAN
jgi:cysteine-rich repeat protein